MKTINYPDGSKNKAYVFSTDSKAETTIVCLPALGVRASYYEQFNKVWQAKGFNVVCIDWRGNGNSSERPSRKNDWGYKQLIQDLNVFLKEVENWFPNTKKVLVGHSLGGQLGCLLNARFAGSFDKTIIIACCLVHYTGWEKVGSTYKIKFAGNVFYPISKIVGHFPGRVFGFGGNEARTIMKDWCHNALTGKYEVANSGFDYEVALGKMSTPFLAISLEDDDFAPVLATRKLYEKFNVSAPIKHLTVTKEETGIENLNHFNWAKHPEYFVEVIANWVEATSA